MCYMELAKGALRAPFEPPASRDPAGLAAERAASPPLLTGGAQMPDHRTAVVRARVTAAEHADWLAKAAAASVLPSRLLRQAMARTRTWTAAATEVERERTRQVARIGNNLNQIARWANSQAMPIDTFKIIAHLIIIEREIARLAGLGGERQDGRGPSR